MSEENNTEQEGVAETSESEVATAAEELKVDKWSWGAFMFEPVFLIATKRYKYLLLFLLYLIPFLNILAVIAVKVFMGLRGRRLAIEGPAFKNKDEWRGFVRSIDHAGFVMFIVTLVGIVLGFIMLVAGVMTFADKMDQMGTAPFDDAQFEAQLEAEFMDAFGEDFKIDIDVSNQ